jgi:DNA-binding NarL/FixJ family response regulator
VPRLLAWGAHVLLYTSEESPHLLQEALLAGVSGVCLKRDGIDDLVDAISAVGRGGTVLSSSGARALLEHGALRARLTAVEIETLRAVAYGKTTKEIADLRCVEASTVDSHIEHIRRKYADATGTKVNRVTMVRVGVRDGYVDRRHLGEDPQNT